jgi:uncharacterized YigZ family protein
MNPKDAYSTLASNGEGLFKDKGSKFMAYASPIKTESEFTVFLEKIRKEHPKARHLCYAWRLGLTSDNYRLNDDGEPSGTAGRPIMGQIDAANLTYVGVVVVRYFGGTLLGTSGLIAAYRESAATALSSATKIDCWVEDLFEMVFDYVKMPDVMNAIKRLRIKVLEQDFSDSCRVKWSVRQSETATTLVKLRAAINHISIEEAEMFEDTEGVRFTKIEN